MCGIVGYTGRRVSSEVLLQGLRRLEYRGYDSAGIAIGNGGSLSVVKRPGKIKDLTEAVTDTLKGHYGIGHTRWATHGVVNEINAHPHTDVSGKTAICHNGIIENYMALKEMLISEGYSFVSETDSEVIAHLIAYNYQGDIAAAVKTSLPLLKGTYGIVCIHADEPGRIIGARNGSPLVIGVGEDEMFLASDTTAVLAYTKQAVYLEDGEIVLIDPEGFKIVDAANREIQKRIDTISWELDQIEKDGFQYYMEKEIREQPESILRAFQGRLNRDAGTAHLGGLNMGPQELINLERVSIIAAGTSYYAGLVGAYLLESVARLPATADLSSEIRYRNPVVEKNSLHFAVSQSGETIDTLFALRELQRKGAKVLGICNVVGSTIARESDGGTYIHSGPEIAVASTKAFTSQITVFYLFTLLMARMRHMSWDQGLEFINALESVPDKVAKVLEGAEHIRALAEKYSDAKNFLFLGRGINYPVALEGALKLKEISYIHAEGFSSAEIKHGPIALINEETPSVFIVPDDHLRDKVVSNMKEVKARDGKVIALAVEGDAEVAAIADDTIFVPKTHELFYPYVMVVPLQMFAYYMALKLGRDVDQPRNLAKSVTVE